MFPLATIQRMNSAIEARKAKRRAQALNAKNKKHPKNAEKTGAATPEKPSADKIIASLSANAKDRAASNQRILAEFYQGLPPYTAEELLGPTQPL